MRPHDIPSAAQGRNIGQKGEPPTTEALSENPATQGFQEPTSESPAALGFQEERWKARYQRQIRLASIGESGQRRLSAMRLGLVGCGALGSSLAEILIRAGVGFLRLIDRDLVEWSNLPRQHLYTEDDAAKMRPKVFAASSRLRQIASDARLDPRFEDLRPGNVEAFLEGIDLVLDGTDNLETRYLLNDACTKRGLPWIYGACVGSHGQVMLCQPPKTACFQCLFPEALPSHALQTCDTTGILGSLPPLIASLQATLALRWCLEPDKTLLEGLLHVDLWPMSFVSLPPPPIRASCPCCQEKTWHFLQGRDTQQIRVLCGQEGLQILPAVSAASSAPLHLPSLAEKLRPLGTILETDLFVRCETPAWTLFLFPDGRALFRGLIEPSQARSFYAQVIGL